MSHRERENKFCTKCQKVKTIYEFNINSNGRYYSWCRSCMSEYGKEYQKKMRAMNSATIQTTLTERNRRLQIHIGQELYYQEKIPGKTHMYRKVKVVEIYPFCVIVQTASGIKIGVTRASMALDLSKEPIGRPYYPGWEMKGAK